MTSPEVAGNEGNVFTRKLGPLPMWAWMGLVLLAAVLYRLYSGHKNSANTTASPSTVNTPGGVDASLVPQFVNQNFENSSPPPSGPINVNATLSGNPNQPVVTQQEGTPGTTVQGLSVTPYKHRLNIGFGAIPGNKNGYVVQIINKATNKYVYNRTVNTTHPQITSALAPGTYELLVTGKGYTGTSKKTFTVT